MRVVSIDGATVINHQDTEYQAGRDGVFELPTHVANELLAFPGWQIEHEYLKAQAAAEQEARTEPDVIADRIAALEARLDALEAKRPPGRPRKDA